jgi:hypothetical protein
MYRFGNYELDEQRCELRCAGQLVAIEPKVFEVLAYPEVWTHFIK